jgi:hypothetical protein
MSLIFPHHVSLMKRHLAISKKPNLKYFKVYTRKLRSFQKHYLYYLKFKQAPNIIEVNLWETLEADLEVYHSLLFETSLLWEVAFIWHKGFIYDNFRSVKSVKIVGQATNVELARRHLIAMVELVELLARKEANIYRKAKFKRRRGLRARNIVETDESLLDVRKYENWIRDTLISNLSWRLFKLHDSRKTPANLGPIYRYILLYVLKTHTLFNVPSGDALRLLILTKYSSFKFKPQKLI